MAAGALSVSSRDQLLCYFVLFSNAVRRSSHYPTTLVCFGTILAANSNLSLYIRQLVAYTLVAVVGIMESFNVSLGACMAFN